MNSLPHQRTRKLTIIAQDSDITAPAVSVLTAHVEILVEVFEAGPRGSCLPVVSYEASTGTYCRPLAAGDYGDGRDACGFDTSDVSSLNILNDPRFRAQTSFAGTARIVQRFERALRRRVPWSFPGHQLETAPHVFADTTAFYCTDEDGQPFGYFMSLEELSEPPNERAPAYTALSTPPKVLSQVVARVRSLADEKREGVGKNL